MRDLEIPARAFPPAAATAPPRAEALRVRDLHLAVDGRRLLDVPDLQLDAGSITFVMGHNGAGKSLLLRVMHGLVACPGPGLVTIGDRPLDRALRVRQAMVFQTPVVLRRSVAANLDFAITAHGRRDPERRDALLCLVELQHKARQSARLLSGGERQRLALARALALDPDILLLDEPTASLDPVSAALIERLVRTASRDGRKIVFVSHDPRQARRLAQDVVFLARGRVVSKGPAEAFFHRPRAPEARAYLDGRLPG